MLAAAILSASVNSNTNSEKLFVHCATRIKAVKQDYTTITTGSQTASTRLCLVMWTPSQGE